MARREDHLGQILGVPRAQNEPSVVGIRLERLDDARQLVISLACIVGLGIDVLGTEVAPLETVYGTQVADFAVGEAQIVEELAGSVPVPDLDPFGGEVEG